jgi:Bacterial SH3 domain
MRDQRTFRVNWIISALLIVFIAAGCAGTAKEATSEPAATATSEVSSPTAESTEAPAQPSPAPVADKNVLYQDEFTNPASGWPEEKFDNYFIGYHEPEYYHVEIDSPNYKTTVFEPNKDSFNDFTVEVKVFTVSQKTATSGDFNYGIAFRRSGDNYYAFTISPRTKMWYVLKSSPTALTTLAQGTEDSIHDLDAADVLRVDAQGSNFSFYINDHSVGQVTDSDYASGEVGFYAQTIDATNIHIHFDSISIRKLTPAQDLGATAVMLYQDDFSNPASGWAEKKFDNYFIGYHEPEYYHVEIDSPNYKTTVFEPNKDSFDDVTIQVKAYTVSQKTATTGDFIFGPAFRRSGDDYYAFTISPRTQKWSFLKSSPSALTVLAEGSEAGINSDLDTEDVLRVDAQGSKFFLHINDQLVGQVTDSDYASGEVGFFVETFDATNVHVHFDSLAITDYVAPLVCNVNALALNVRSGPGTSFASSEFLSKGDTIIPVGRSADGTWIKVRLENSADAGWVFNANEYVACSSAVDLLPVADQ